MRRMEQEISFVERREEINLCNPFYGDGVSNELKEIDKHEILVKICSILGASPENFSVAENIFNDIRFEIARYVLHHEYCRSNTIRSKLLLWLDSKISPDNAAILEKFCEQYLKR